VFGLGGDQEKVESDENQLAGYQDARRITVWLGKIAAPDFFDNNTYSHDPRTQFMNESLMDDSAWDYPADTRGYTIGGVIEYNEPAWAIRYGVFQEPHTANGGTLDPHVPQALGQAVELENRWSLKDQPGVIRTMAYANVAHMGNYREAIAEAGPGGIPNIALARTYDVKYGFSISAEQAITSDLGIWGRGGWNNGQTESWAFTEVDDLGSLGISLKGTAWHRPDDVFGFAGAIAGLSDAHKDYLAAGGLGFIIGDGQLSYAPEEVLETYYNCKIADGIFITPDAQFINNPAYNSARGPVGIFGLRVHVER
jgi:high affinity Mn2+ porin